VKDFFTENLKRIRRIPLGCSPNDKLKLLGIAALQSIPQKIRTHSNTINTQIEQTTKQTCNGLTIHTNNLKYKVLDRESLEIVCPDFETFMQPYFTPKKDQTVLDVGANVGKYTLQAAKKVGNHGQVISIEADNQNYKTLQQSIKLNQLNNILLLNIAAYNKECQLKFYIGDTTARHSLKSNQNHGFHIVTAKPLDKVLTENNITRIDWIKIDVEGAEYETLLGLQKTLENNKPKIIIEVVSTNIPKVKTLLINKGYQITEIAKFGIPGDYCAYFYCRKKRTIT
jgi:FkbM family methyltransferase